MTRPSRTVAVPRAQNAAQRALQALEHFLHVESASGIVLLLAAAAALIWANSPFSESYQHFWHTPLSFGFGEYQVSYSIHFWINDALMTVFFLVVGMEIRREIHDGALASLKEASLPVAAALGGVLAPALIYLAVTGDAPVREGWAVPTATDIAFALGVLALLGNKIPPSVRIFLLALAIIDDIVAVLIIAVFYSGGLNFFGFAIAGIGILLVLLMQRLKIGSAYAYVLPGAIVWIGLLKAGAHPTLAGVLLGLMTPAVSRSSENMHIESALRAINDFRKSRTDGSEKIHDLMKSVNQLGYAQRELLPPVMRVQIRLHPWVAFGIMPLFALANAGIGLDGISTENSDSQIVMMGIALALILGKPAGIVAMSALMVLFGWCRLPIGMNWWWLALIGVLAGIGFTMSIFISMLAFNDDSLLTAAKLGVLVASLSAGVIGLLFGHVLVKRQQ